LETEFHESFDEEVQMTRFSKIQSPYYWWLRISSLRIFLFSSVQSINFANAALARMNSRVLRMHEAQREMGIEVDSEISTAVKNGSRVLTCQLWTLAKVIETWRVKGKLYCTQDFSLLSTNGILRISFFPGRIIWFSTDPTQSAGQNNVLLFLTVNPADTSVHTLVSYSEAGGFEMNVRTRIQ
jgi:hypothetical protein